MRGSRSLWLLSLPLMAAGSFAARAASYRLAIPDAHERADSLALTGHAYLEHVPLIAALLVAPALIAVLRSGYGAARGRPVPVRVWWFAVLPPLSADATPAGRNV